MKKLRQKPVRHVVKAKAEVNRVVLAFAIRFVRKYVVISWYQNLSPLKNWAIGNPSKEFIKNLLRIS